MDNQNYLNDIHKKIRYKKRRNNFVGSVGAITVCFMVFFFAPKIEEDILFNDFYDSISYYDWELIDEPSTDDILDYLIDYTCIEDYDQLMEEELLDLINDMNL